MVIRNVGEQATLVHCCWGCKSVENSTESSKKKKKEIKLLYDPAILLLGIYPKNMKTLV